MEELLKKLNIEGKPNKTSKGYILNIENSNEFSKVYSKLENSDLVEEIFENSQITPDTVSIQYDAGDYLLTLLGDLAGDAYTLTILDN